MSDDDIPIEDLQRNAAKSLENDESIYPEHLQGDRPKMWGFDYYNLIYTAAAVLCGVMGYLFFIVEDDEVKRMVMMQGALSICLLMASMYFRRNLHKQQRERVLEKWKNEQQKLLLQAAERPRRRQHVRY